jgi:hypothetical protein
MIKASPQAQKMAVVPRHNFRAAAHDWFRMGELSRVPTLSGVYRPLLGRTCVSGSVDEEFIVHSASVICRLLRAKAFFFPLHQFELFRRIKI